jgi:hypothetical protein
MTSAASLPTRFSIAAGNSSDQVALIDVAGLKDGESVVSREVEVQIPRDRVAELFVFLAAACVGKICPAGKTCDPATGGCVSTGVDLNQLPPYMPGDQGDATTDSTSPEDARPTTDAATEANSGGPDATTDAQTVDAATDATLDAAVVADVQVSDGDAQSPIGLGASCSKDTECGTGHGHCVDGVCCDGACVGSCVQCDLAGLKGRCSPVSAGATAPPSRAACPMSSTMTCGNDGKCDGKGNCELWGNGTACGGASCNAATNTSTNGSSCDGLGQCVPGSSSPCAPFKCASSGSGCAATCSVDGDCVGAPCVNHSCGTLADGAMCSADAQCTHGHCVDGYCCNSACTLSCQACDVAGAKGKCTTLTSGQPHGKRSPCTNAGTTCGGSCTGGASCTYPTAVCAAASCANGVEYAAASCDGAGVCPMQVTTSCKGFTCNGATCNTTCAKDTQCLSGHCVDGYCCNSTCLASCQACDVPGSEGTCTTLTSGQPHGSRSACTNAGGTCGGSCTGSISCTYPTSVCSPQTCTNGTLYSTTSCDGAGTCPPPMAAPCNGGYACNGTTCYTFCSTDQQCQPPLHCNMGTGACQ